LREIAARLRESLPPEEPEHPERRAARAQLEVLRMAKAAFAVAGDERLAEQTERAIVARALALEGDREGAARAREGAPSRANQGELLLAAARLMRERNAPDRADALQRLGEQMLHRESAPAQAERRLKVMRYAVEALVAANRHDAAELMERAEHALKVAGRSDAEAREIRARAPDARRQRELLMLAGEILQDRGQAERAHAVLELAGAQGRERSTEPDLEAIQVRLQRITDRVRRIEEALERLQRGR
jgi:hypothetical protein